MIKPNDRPTLNQPINISVNFTFATPKSKKKNQQDRDVNSAEKKVVGMWLGTVLELHSDEFVLALKSSRKFSVVELSKYLSKYYPHLKTIVQYYIIAALIDYQLIVSDIDEESSLDKQCPFINIVIEELTSRFFVESQWLHKISYLPIYRIFPLFDHCFKGYTTVSELRNMVKQELTAKPVKARVSFQKQQRLKLKKQKLLNLKLKNNIQGQDVNIYQENVEQLMLRVNLVHFEQKLGAASQRYESIKRILQDYDHFITEKYQKECEQMVREKIKHKEQLQIMKENQKIKQRSNLLSKANQQKQNQNALNKQNQIDKAEYSYKVPESIFSTMPHYSSNLIASKPQNLDSSLISRNRQLGKYSTLNYDTAVRTQAQVEQLAVLQRVEEEMKENMLIRQNQLHHEFVDENLKQIQKNKRTIQYRNSILEQLQFIREQKKTNHFRLLNYI